MNNENEWNEKWIMESGKTENEKNKFKDIKIIKNQVRNRKINENQRLQIESKLGKVKRRKRGILVKKNAIFDCKSKSSLRCRLFYKFDKFRYI